MDALQSVLAYVVCHPWKTAIFAVLTLFAFQATWQQFIVALVIAAFVAVFDT